MDFQLKGTPAVEEFFCVALFSPPLQDKCRPKSRAARRSHQQSPATPPQGAAAHELR
jgi:hypothetical protein